jgi:phospholipid/cholesterol/gamma-HCH transport system substrate-binding protein
VEDKVNYTLVGAFVLVLGAALVAGVLWLAVGLGGQKKVDPYASIFAESVAGLSIDAPVKFLGVDVGKVSRIEIDPQDSRQVRLHFLIERGTPIKQDSEAVLKTQGLTGIAYVELSGGSPAAAPLRPSAEQPEPIIRSKPSLSARLENLLGTALAGLDRMSGNLNAVFDAENRAALKQTLADLATLTHTLAAQKETISAGIDDAARTAQQAAMASAQLDPLLERLATAASAVDSAAQALGQTSQTAGEVAAGAASGVQQLQTETLPDLARLMADLSRLAESLRHLSEQTERQPSSLLIGRPTQPPGPGESAPP